MAYWRLSSQHLTSASRSSQSNKKVQGKLPENLQRGLLSRYFHLLVITIKTFSSIRGEKKSYWHYPTVISTIINTDILKIFINL